ncbi:MAG: hypothetical protein JXR39_11715 [Marinilabiliaceae bacterium]|nr:hypothetical protein [Marinilabiliaceae bacterium]
MLAIHTTTGSTYWTFMSEDQLFVISHNGQLSYEHMRENYLKIAADRSLPRTLNVLHDCRNGHFTYDIGRVQELVSIFEEMSLCFDQVVWADLHNQPKMTAYGFMFANLIDNPRIQYRLFSSEEEAMGWLTNKRVLAIKQLKVR